MVLDFTISTQDVTKPDLLVFTTKYKHQNNLKDVLDAQYSDLIVITPLPKRHFNTFTLTPLQSVRTHQTN